MATTSPDNIWTPDSGDDYALTVDLAAMADTIQDALTEIHDDLDPLVEDTGWVNMTISSGFETQSGREPQARVIRNILYTRGLLVRTAGFASSTVYNNVASVPTGLYPGFQYDRQLSANSAHLSVRGYLSSGGGITLITGPDAPAYVDISGLSGMPVN